MNILKSAIAITIASSIPIVGFSQENAIPGQGGVLNEVPELTYAEEFFDSSGTVGVVLGTFEANAAGADFGGILTDLGGVNIVPQVGQFVRCDLTNATFAAQVDGSSVELFEDFAACGVR